MKQYSLILPPWLRKCIWYLRSLCGHVDSIRGPELDPKPGVVLKLSYKEHFGVGDYIVDLPGFLIPTKIIRVENGKYTTLGAYGCKSEYDEDDLKLFRKLQPFELKALRDCNDGLLSWFFHPDWGLRGLNFTERFKEPEQHLSQYYPHSLLRNLIRQGMHPQRIEPMHDVKGGVYVVYERGDTTMTLLFYPNGTILAVTNSTSIPRDVLRGEAEVMQTVREFLGETPCAV